MSTDADNRPNKMFMPSVEDVRAYLKKNRMTGSAAARRLYLSGANQVRSYTGGRQPRRMSGARWFVLAAHEVLDEHQIAEIEKKMHENIKKKLTSL